MDAGSTQSVDGPPANPPNNNGTETNNNINYNEVEMADVGSTAQPPTDDPNKNDPQFTNDDNIEQSSPTESDILQVPFFSLFKYTNASDRVIAALAVTGALATSSVYPILSILMGQYVRSVYGSDLMDQVIRLSLIFVYIGVAVMVASYLNLAMWMLFAERVVRRIRQLYLESLIRNEIAWHDMQNIGDTVVVKLISNTQRIREGIGEKLGQIIQGIGGCLVGIGIAFYYGWELTLVIAACSPAIIIVALVFTIFMSKLTAREQRVSSEAGNLATETFGAVTTVKSLKMESYLTTMYSKKIKGVLATSIRKGWLQAFAIGAFMMMMFVIYAIGLYYGAVCIRDGKFAWPNKPYDGAIVLTIFYALVLSVTLLGQATPSFRAVATAQSCAYPLFEIIDRKSPIDPLSPDGLVVPPDKYLGSISLVDVWFSYPSRAQQPILRGMNLTFEPGLNALIGTSGCGKSTAMQLLSRFYDPEWGGVMTTCMLTGEQIQQLRVAERAHQGEIVQICPSQINKHHKPTQRVITRELLNTFPNTPGSVALNATALTVPQYTGGNMINSNTTNYSSDGNTASSQEYDDSTENGDHYTHSMSSDNLHLGPDHLQSVTLDIRMLNLGNWREQMALVPQDPVLFTGTIRDNLLHANSNATEDELIKATKQAAIYDTIMAFDNKFDEPVGEGGKMLSGGQRQRLCIARAFLANKRILLLDEFCASLDVTSSSLVHQALHAWLNEPNLNGDLPRTAILVTHKLSTIRNANKIMVLDQGNVAECGNHEELMKSELGLYRSLVETQENQLMEAQHEIAAMKAGGSIISPSDGRSSGMGLTIDANTPATSVFGGPTPQLSPNAMTTQSSMSTVRAGPHDYDAAGGRESFRHTPLLLSPPSLQRQGSSNVLRMMSQAQHQPPVSMQQRLLGTDVYQRIYAQGQANYPSPRGTTTGAFGASAFSPQIGNNTIIAPGPLLSGGPLLSNGRPLRRQSALDTRPSSARPMTASVNISALSRPSLLENDRSNPSNNNNDIDDEACEYIKMKQAIAQDDEILGGGSAEDEFGTPENSYIDEPSEFMTIRDDMTLDGRMTMLQQQQQLGLLSPGLMYPPTFANPYGHAPNRLVVAPITRAYPPHVPFDPRTSMLNRAPMATTGNNNISGPYPSLQLTPSSELARPSLMPTPSLRMTAMGGGSLLSPGLDARPSMMSLHPAPSLYQHRSINSSGQYSLDNNAYGRDSLRITSMRLHPTTTGTPIDRIPMENAPSLILSRTPSQRHALGRNLATAITMSSGRADPTFRGGDDDEKTYYSIVTKQKDNTKQSHIVLPKYARDMLHDEGARLRPNKRHALAAAEQGQNADDNDADIDTLDESDSDDDDDTATSPPIPGINPNQPHKNLLVVDAYAPTDLELLTEEISVLVSAARNSADNATGGHGAKTSRISSARTNKPRMKKKTTLQFMFYLMGLAKPFWGKLLIGHICGAVEGFAMPAYALLMDYVLTAFFMPDPGDMMDRAGLGALLFLAIGAGYFTFGSVRYGMFSDVGETIVMQLRHDAYIAMLNQEMGWHDQEHNAPAILVTKLVNDAGYYRNLLLDYYSGIWVTFCNVILSFVVCYTSAWEHTTLMLGLFPLITGCALLQHHALSKFGKNGLSALHEPTQHVSEFVTSIRVVAAFRRETYVSTLFNTALTQHLSSEQRAIQIAGVLTGFSYFVMFGCYALSFWFGGLMVEKGNQSPMAMVRIFMALQVSSGLVAQHFQMIPHITSSLQSVRDLIRVVNRNVKMWIFNPDGTKVHATSYIIDESETLPYLLGHHYRIPKDFIAKYDEELALEAKELKEKEAKLKAMGMAGDDGDGNGDNNNNNNDNNNDDDSTISSARLTDQTINDDNKTSLTYHGSDNNNSMNGSIVPTIYGSAASIGPIDGNSPPSIQGSGQTYNNNNQRYNHRGSVGSLPSVIYDDDHISIRNVSSNAPSVVPSTARNTLDMAPNTTATNNNEQSISTYPISTQQGHKPVSTATTATTTTTISTLNTNNNTNTDHVIDMDKSVIKIDDINKMNTSQQIEHNKKRSFVPPPIPQWILERVTKGELRIVNLNFAYPTRLQHVLYHKMNVTIPAGKTTAIIGPSGCGKSSLLNLFLRFYDPVETLEIQVDPVPTATNNNTSSSTTTNKQDEFPLSPAAAILASSSPQKKKQHQTNEDEEKKEMELKVDDDDDDNNKHHGNKATSPSSKVHPLISYDSNGHIQGKHYHDDNDNNIAHGDDGQSTPPSRYASQFHTTRDPVKPQLSPQNRFSAGLYDDPHHISGINTPQQQLTPRHSAIAREEHPSSISPYNNNGMLPVAMHHIDVSLDGSSAISTGSAEALHGRLSTGDIILPPMSSTNPRVGAGAGVNDVYSHYHNNDQHKQTTTLPDYARTLDVHKTWGEKHTHTHTHHTGSDGGVTRHAKRHAPRLSVEQADADEYQLAEAARQSIEPPLSDNPELAAIQIRTGSVFIDNVDLRELSLFNLRTLIGIVEQYPKMFSGSVMDNLKCGDHTISDNAVFKATRIANIHDSILKFPQGYNTNMGPSGRQLSGGQRARLAIARALVQDPKVLLLDEITASLDPKSERAVQTALSRAVKGRTVVMIAHRLDTIIQCDNIVVMDHGAVAETGTHSALLNHNGVYWTMWQSALEQGLTQFQSMEEVRLGRILRRR